MSMLVFPEAFPAFVPTQFPRGGSIATVLAAFAKLIWIRVYRYVFIVGIIVQGKVVVII